MRWEVVVFLFHNWGTELRRKQAIALSLRKPVAELGTEP